MTTGVHKQTKVILMERQQQVKSGKDRVGRKKMKWNGVSGNESLNKEIKICHE